jgi:septal ring factor EnvC (AmiA/AmiB activator)
MVESRFERIERRVDAFFQSIEARLAPSERRIDALVSSTAQDMIWGKALYRQFDQHCKDDEQRHSENVQTLAELEKTVKDQGAQTAAAIDRLTAAIEAQANARKTLSDQLDAMTPTFRRLRHRQATRRAIVHCLSRWRHMVVVAGISAAGMFAWLDGHWPRIAALVRKVFGP